MFLEVGILGKELKRNREKYKYYVSVSFNMIGIDKKNIFLKYLKERRWEKIFRRRWGIIRKENI